MPPAKGPRVQGRHGVTTTAVRRDLAEVGERKKIKIHHEWKRWRRGIWTTKQNKGLGKQQCQSMRISLATKVLTGEMKRSKKGGNGKKMEEKKKRKKGEQMGEEKSEENNWLEIIYSISVHVCFFTNWLLLYFPYF